MDDSARGLKTPRIPSEPFNKALIALQKVGLLAELSMTELEGILKVLNVDAKKADDELASIDFLKVYYRNDQKGLSARAIADGFLHHDWRFSQETDDVVAEICQLVGRVMLKQVGFSEEPSKGSAASIPMMTVEWDNGNRSTFPVNRGLEDILAYANRTLERVGDKRRFISIPTQADWFAYYLMDSLKWKMIFGPKSPALPSDGIPGINEKKWQKS